MSAVTTTNKSTYSTLMNWFPLILLIAIVIMCVIFPAQAHASTSTGMAWEDPLSKIKDSIKGPVAFTISLLGIIGAGAALIWGGEINEFVRKLIYLVLVISLLAFGTTILSNLFGIGGALITMPVSGAH